jgi:hypothetical protein
MLSIELIRGTPTGFQRLYNILPKGLVRDPGQHPDQIASQSRWRFWRS